VPNTAPVIPGVYECPDCGERLLQRRCPDCNRFARRIGNGGCCPACGDTITLDELLEATTI
jgi:predicted amidophosphoribosyltransferase